MDTNSENKISKNDLEKIDVVIKEVIDSGIYPQLIDNGKDDL